MATTAPGAPVASANKAELLAIAAQLSPATAESTPA